MLRRAVSLCAALGVCLYIAVGSDEQDFKGGAGWYRLPATGLRGPDEVEVVEGGAATVPVSLASRPAGAVTVAVALEGGGGALALDGAGELRFTPENWNEPQPVAVSARADEDADDAAAFLVLTRAGIDAPLRVPLVAADEDPAADGDFGFAVKDSSGYGAAGYPVTAVIPLAYGRFQSTRRFRILDAEGEPVPAQFEVLTRWWARDRSLRHVAAHFEATVAANGSANYRFTAGAGPAPRGAHQVSVAEEDGALVVDTGVLRFRLATRGFNLFDEVSLDQDGDGEYEADERIVARGASDGPVFTGRLPGDVQKARDRENLDVRVEERGPRRAVVRIESLGALHGRDDHRHGFAVRVYAYAGRSYVKVDYQLQNSAINVMRSWPLYFEDVSLHLKPSLERPILRLSPRFRQVWKGGLGSAGRYLLQSSLAAASVHDSASGEALKQDRIRNGESSFGWADLSDGRRGVTAIVRHMAEMWPNAIEVEPDLDFFVRLWPKQSCQWFDERFTETGLYWLEDMQHVVKETLFYFHGPQAADAELEALAANFGYFPVVSIPLDVYRETRSTFDLDGLIPPRARSSGRGGNRPRYRDRQLDPGSSKYNFGWMNFGGSVSRKYSAATGGYPSSSTEFCASGHVSDFFEAERSMWGDLNTRPMWMAGYEHDRDFIRIQPTVNPYAGKSWRVFGGKKSSPFAYDYLPGTGSLEWRPRDNQHGWFYHIEEYFYLSANPWVRDWYEWIGEFRKRSLLRRKGTSKYSKNPYDLAEWGFGTRGEGHLLANGWQAYRLTGDPQLLAGLENRLDWLMSDKWHPRWGHLADKNKSEAAFHIGYVARGVCNFLTEMKGYDPAYEQKAFAFLWGLMDWHFEHSQYSGWLDVREGERPEKSSGTALTMVDPTILWYRWSGQRKHLDLTTEYVSRGLRGGRKPYGTWGGWEGGWEGRAYFSEAQAPKKFGPGPPPVRDLAATASGGRVRIEWTAPEHAARYLVVWSRQPVSGAYTDDKQRCNFWAAEVVPNTLVAQPGAKQSLEFEAGRGPVHVALVSFAADDHMSEPSNVATTDVP